MAYLDCGDVEIDNNGAELVIKPFVVGCKNWTFMRSQNVAKAGAVLYSLIETLMPWNVSLPFDYLSIDYGHLQNN